MLAQFPEISRLNSDEKLQLMEELWESLERDDSPFVLSDWMKKELDKRKEEFEKDPSQVMTWEEMVAEIRRGRE